jgi:hypothetical protein
VAGSLADLAFGPADVTRGGFSLRAPTDAPEERGAPLWDLAPSYAPGTALRPFGLGWSLPLSIQRFRLVGDIDYEQDAFTGPWGQLLAGDDGWWYVLGLAPPIRLQREGTGAWTAVGPEGNRYTFAQTHATEAGTYAWYLTQVTDLFGGRTTLTYEQHDAGAPWLREVAYGRAGHEHDQLSTAMASSTSWCWTARRDARPRSTCGTASGAFASSPRGSASSCALPTAVRALPWTDTGSRSWTPTATG